MPAASLLLLALAPTVAAAEVDAAQVQTQTPPEDEAVTLLPDVVVTVSSSSPDLFELLMVSVRLPSALSTVASVVEKSAVVSPLTAVATVLVRPVAFVVAMVRSSSAPPDVVK